MIKKLKLGLLVAVLSLAVGVSSANAANLTYSADTNVYLTGSGYTITIKSGSDATSVVVNASSIDVVVPISSTFTIASHNNTDLSGAGGATSTTNTCSGTTNTRVITTGAGSTGTYTITPNGGVCAASSGGGGGGGGGSSTSSVPYVAPATVATKVIQGCNGTAGYSTVTGESCQFNTGGITTTTPASTSVASTTSSSASATFSVTKLGTATLKNGSKGNSVKELQKVLNKILNTNLVVDGKLGPKTIAQIKVWQKAHGLKADGLVGKLTKAAMVAEANK